MLHSKYKTEIYRKISESWQLYCILPRFRFSFLGSLPWSSTNCRRSLYSIVTIISLAFSKMKSLKPWFPFHSPNCSQNILLKITLFSLKAIRSFSKWPVIISLGKLTMMSKDLSKCQKSTFELESGQNLWKRHPIWLIHMAKRIQRNIICPDRCTFLGRVWSKSWKRFSFISILMMKPNP